MLIRGQVHSDVRIVKRGGNAYAKKNTVVGVIVSGDAFNCNAAIPDIALVPRRTKQTKIDESPERNHFIAGVRSARRPGLFDSHGEFDAWLLLRASKHVNRESAGTYLGRELLRVDAALRATLSSLPGNLLRDVLWLPSGRTLDVIPRGTFVELKRAGFPSEYAIVLSNDILQHRSGDHTFDFGVVANDDLDEVAVAAVGGTAQAFLDVGQRGRHHVNVRRRVGKGAGFRDYCLGAVSVGEDLCLS